MVRGKQERSCIGDWFDAVSLRMSTEPNVPIVQHMYTAAQNMMELQRTQRIWDERIFVATVADMNAMMRNQYAHDTSKMMASSTQEE